MRARAALLHVVLPLAGGVALYLALRAPDIRLFAWARALALDPVVAALRAAAAPLRPHAPAWLLGSAPDGAWAYAFGAALGSMWQGQGGARGARAWLAAGAAMTAFLEIGQGAGLVPGVFDPLDLVFMLGGYGLGWAIQSKNKNKNENPRRPGGRGGLALAEGGRGG